mgnify:FL=1
MQSRRTENTSRKTQTGNRKDYTYTRKRTASSAVPVNSDIKPLILSELKAMNIKELEELGKSFDIESATNMLRQELIFALLNAQTAKGGAIFSFGVLETLPDGFGFLRSPDFSYVPGPDDIYVSPSQIRRFNLKTGDTIEGQVRPPKDSERYYALLKVEKLNFEDPISFLISVSLLIVGIYNI